MLVFRSVATSFTSSMVLSSFTEPLQGFRADRYIHCEFMRHLLQSRTEIFNFHYFFFLFSLPASLLFSKKR